MYTYCMLNNNVVQTIIIKVHNVIHDDNAFLGVGYSFTDLMNLRLGYRYTGAAPNNKFGSIRNHVFEGSLGASF